MTSIRAAIAAAALVALAACQTATSPAVVERVSLPPDAVSAGPGERIDTQELLDALAPVIAANGGFGVERSPVPAIAEDELPGVPRAVKWKRPTRVRAFWFAADGTAESTGRRLTGSQWNFAMPGTHRIDEEGRLMYDAHFDSHLTLYRRGDGSLACLIHAPSRPKGEKDYLQSCRILAKKPF